jgi:hypothetical protein
MIKTGGETLYSETYRLIFSIWNKEELPQQWKESIIVTIYKTGNETDCDNCRGISLLSTLYTILSNFLLARLNPHINEITGGQHCGFRQNRSTTDQIFYIRQIIEKKWESNGSVHQLYLDLKKTCNSGGKFTRTFCLNLVYLGR